MKAIPWWSWACPLVAWVLLVAKTFLPVEGPILVIFVLALGGAVFAGVHFAEVIAHKLGEPFGTLVLAVAVTIIEVALIVSVMLGGGADKAALARDTVFSAVMIVCAGVVGFCLLAGATRHREQEFRIQGANGALAVIIALSGLTMVLPNYTQEPGPSFTVSQLEFVGLVSLVMYGVFVFVQTVRHREYFLPEVADEDSHAAPPSNAMTLASLGLLIVSLVAVVGLAKALSPAVEAAVKQSGAPQSLVGVIIAAVVLLPESLAAVRAARMNRLQTSLNLAFGSVIASIGLTIPVVAVVSVLIHQPLTLGLDPKETVMLALTMLISTLTIATGRTSILQGAIHLMLFAVFLFFAVVP
ncbi:ionic transporter y4hA [Acidisoma cellulosilytica]|uniref:Ionic transporter y4hA n=1 Tax=Acidisoma cellulosilyticum TaxID=2802395 RepID=A0A964E5A4_9PROT|nr:ionic transporter y4hA [Acidisoma cellulosilyticum]MCB8882299.1 ionic transporter y4hA [Acidisoma cellulosilyticum]